MGSIRIDAFLGLNLVKEPALGPFFSAVKAVNCELAAQELGQQAGAIGLTYNLDTSVGGPKSLAVGDPKHKIYHLNGETFLQWTLTPGPTAGVDVVESPLADNTTRRMYYTGGGGVPRVTNLSMALAGTGLYPNVSFVLGMTIGPKIGQIDSAGGSPTENRAYLYTFVSPWGEEGPPSEPLDILSATGATVTMRLIGVTTRKYSSSPIAPVGVAASVTFIGAPAPGFLRFTLTDPGYSADFRAGDRFYHYTLSPTLWLYQSFLASSASSAGNGTIEVAANCWSAAGLTPTIWRVLPANTYNLVAATADLPSTGKVTVFVDTTQGLRAGESVTIAGVVGMTSLNTTHVIESIGTDLQNPSFVVALTTAQVFVFGTGIATRTAPHNTGELRITGITYLFPTATLTLESTANIEAGKHVLIMGVRGAYQINGKRLVSTVTPGANQITVNIAALGAYTDGGVVILGAPNEIEEFTITNVTSAGGPYPVPFLIDITLSKAHSLKVGELVLGQDIGGAIEANNVMSVAAATAGSLVIQCTSACGVTAYTAGGTLIRLTHQYRKRIYRTLTGTTGAEFQMVDDIPGDVARYEDAIAGGGLGDILESDDWIAPPTDLHSLAKHPNGFLVGISKNILCMTPPGHPHAWPLKHQRALPSTGTGLAVYGTSAVAITKTHPVEVSGVVPDSMTVTNIEGAPHGMAKRAVVGMVDGVAYLGPNGWHVVSGGQSAEFTHPLLPRDPSFLAAGDGLTFAQFWRGKLIWLDNAGTHGYMFEPLKGERGMTEFELDYPAYDLHVSPVTGDLWLSYMDGLSPKRSKLFMRHATTPRVAKFTYWTQYIVTPKPVSLGALQVKFDWQSLAEAMRDREDAIIRNTRASGRSGAVAFDELGALEVAGDGLETITTPVTTGQQPTERFLRVTVIANPDSTDDQQTIFDDYIANDTPVRMQNGIKADVHQVRFEGNVRVDAIYLAETIRELEQS